MDYGIWSVIPIALCFLLIFISKNAFVSILSGIVAAVVIVFVGENSFALFDSVLAVASQTSTLMTVVFILIVGAIIKATEHSAGVSGLIGYLERKKINVRSPILAQLFAMSIGILMFVDGTSSMAITSVVGKPLFKKAKIPIEKLAIITNSTAAPIAWIIPFGGAAALITSLITQVEGIEGDAFGYVISAIPFQFYTISLLILLMITVILKIEIGPIKKYKFKEETQEVKAQSDGKARNLVVPIIVLITGILTIMFITGSGNIMAGDGSLAVFLSGLITLAFSLVFYLAQRITTITKCLAWYFEGVASMFMVTLLLAIALVFSNLLTKIGTASYLVTFFDTVPASFLPLIALILSAVIAFSTGTSGGTVAVVTGLVLPMAVLSGVSIPLTVGAIISGSVFGDQSSIISDSVIVTSSVTGVDPVTHVKTQLPYTLIALSISAALYLVIGFM